MKKLRPIYVRLRRHLCQTCPVPCAAHLSGVLELEDPDQACPLTRPRWKAAPRGTWRLGLGDAVALVAQPVAAATDALVGTNLSSCLSCGERHVGLNEAVPDVFRPLRKRRKS